MLREAVTAGDEMRLGNWQDVEVMSGYLISAPDAQGIRQGISVVLSSPAGVE